MLETQNMPWLQDEYYRHINFQWNASRELLGPMWALVGECSSKIEHVSGTPLDKETADHLRALFIAKGVHGTAAIEGNTLSERQVMERVEHPRQDLHLPPSQQYLEQEIDNVIDTCNGVSEQIAKDARAFRLTPEDLKHFNRQILSKLELPPDVQPGEYRYHRVGVGDYRAPEARHVAPMVAMLCEWLNQGQFSAEYGSKFAGPILRAIMAHLYIAWIHPFGDGNGRTARVVEFDILMRAGVPLVCAHLLSDYYNRTRSRYYNALSAARQQHAHFFVDYAINGLREMLVEQIAAIRKLQMYVTWTNYLHSVYHDEGTQSKRRRAVALQLAEEEKPVPLEKLTQLTPKIALQYAGKTMRTIQRDLSSLRGHRLILSGDSGISANLEMVQAFMPFAGKGVKPT